MSHPDEYGDRGTGRIPRGARQRPPQAPRLWQPRPAQRAREFGGAEGNERLTAMTWGGAAGPAGRRVVLLAVEGFTILRVGRLLTLHFFLGMLLLGPVALVVPAARHRTRTGGSGTGQGPGYGKGRPVAQELGQAGQEAAQSLRDSAQQRAQSVKETAADAASTVTGQA
ncbi:MAG TPA: hypothetical protein VHZ03_06985, partial [Trebonia sp.]|nr:hypothetical protein [Trebonia sp.]